MGKTSSFPMNLSLKKKNYKYANSHKTMSYKINLFGGKSLILWITTGSTCPKMLFKNFDFSTHPIVQAHPHEWSHFGCEHTGCLTILWPLRNLQFLSFWDNLDQNFEHFRKARTILNSKLSLLLIFDENLP